jgi:glycosyltransferase involved in cell wall biosynthesis
MNEESNLIKKISIVIPFHNEETGIDNFYLKLTTELNIFSNYVFEVICVDDGSSDNTLQKLQLLVDKDNRFIILELSRNFGKEIALTAGIDFASGQAVIPMDSDLQDPPDVIYQLISKWEEGYEVVLAKRVDRNADSFMKRKTAKIFYKVHNFFSTIKIPENVGDFRLIDRMVINALSQLKEQNRFMKGLFSWVGFRTTTIFYRRQPRKHGHSKFSGFKLWNLAIEGITSFSTLPLRLWTYLGLLGAIISFVYAVTIIIKTILFGADVAGYPSIIVSIIFLGSIQLIGIGTLGEYVGRIYLETKNRPLYFIRKIHKK